MTENIEESSNIDDWQYWDVPRIRNTGILSKSFCSASNISFNCNEPAFDWKPPRKHGLQNSCRILQPAYIDRIINGVPIDYFEILKDDIRNIRPLTAHQLEYIKNLQPDEMIEVIEIFNNVMKLLMQFADVPSNDP